MLKLIWNYSLPVAILTFAILGARLQNNYLLYAMIGLICLAVALVAFDRLDEKSYPYLIFAIGLGLLYQVTLLSPFLVGTDIHYEYYYAYQTLENGYWDYSMPYTYNGAMSVSVFVPYLAKLLHINIEWVFKIVCPLFLASVPIFMYFMFKRFMDNKPAFLAVFFFLSIPTFFLELSGLAKQEIGEFFMVLCLFLFLSTNLRIKTLYRILAIFSIAMLAALSHYVMGVTAVYYLLGAVPILLILRYLAKAEVKTQLKYLGLVAVAIIVLSILFYGWVASGTPLHEITDRVTSQSKIVAGVIPSESILPAPEISTSPETGETMLAPAPEWGHPELLMKAALGLDFLEVDTLSKAYRILQYATQLLIIIGCICVFRRWRHYSPEYLALFCLSGILLSLCVFVTSFSPILNASRFYHIILIFMAPAIVLGGKLVFRNYKVLVLCLLIPYFLFTSGVVFEITKQEDISSVRIPYSHSLSAVRVDTTGVYTEADGVARDWIVENNKIPISADIGAGSFLAEKLGDFGIKVGLYYFCNMPVPDENYIFLRERNVERGTITYYTGIGLRQEVSYAVVGIDKLLEGRDVVFQCGNAMVYSPRN